MLRRVVSVSALLFGGPLTRFPGGESVWKNAVVVAAAVGGLSALGPRIRSVATSL